jgi:hypothetical protein
MIIAKEKSKRVVQSHDFESVNCTIDAEDMRYVASLLRNNYSNPPLAVVREITANGLDANLEAESSRPIEVSIPTKFSPSFRVRDFGGGLSQEDVFGLYSKYGKSTKRDSNNYIGAFGIGKFAPLSYGDSFTCVSYHGGNKSSYNVFVDDNDDTQIVKLHEEPTNEPTGLSVEVAIADSDVNKFREICQAFFRFFSKNEMPKFLGVADDEEFLKEFKIALKDKKDSWFMVDDEQDYYSRSHGQAHAFMGRVHYPINASSINFDAYLDEKDVNAIREICQQSNLYIRFDIGELKLHHSRESLEYNKPTQKAIIQKIVSIYKDIQELAKEKLANAECLWDAKSKYAQVVNALPHSLKDVFKNCFSWNGNSITSSAFSRPYGMHENLIITEYSKSKDSNVSDGYKVTSQKSSRILAYDSSVLVYQDLKSSHGNALRARTLFNQDADLSSVFIVHATDGEGEDYLFKQTDGFRLDLISKENLLNTSDVEKAKLQVGTRASGESRQSVPTFVFTDHGYNNADKWANGEERSNLEKNLKKGEKLVYIAISNYKPSDSEYSLDGLSRQHRHLEKLVKDLKKDSISVLYGVRKADVSKLDEAKWIHWDQYRTDLAKQLLLSNKKVLAQSEIEMAFLEHRSDMEHFHQIDSLMTNQYISTLLSELDSDHNVRFVHNIAKKQGKTGESNTQMLYQLKTMVNQTDKQWVKDNLGKPYNWKSFDKSCKQITEDYPLLEVLSRHLYGWHNIKQSGEGEKIIAYILQCDKLKNS